MAGFHALTVTGVRSVARDAVEVSFSAEDAAMYDFQPGQYLTLRYEIDGVELRRSYSICCAPGDGLRVGVRHVQGGAMSGWINGALDVGTRLESLPPAGRFTLSAATGPRHVLMFAGGSGITPMLSLMRDVLAREPETRVTLIYANRAIATIMFREEIEDLKNLYLGRLSVIHVLEQDAQEIGLFTGRVTQDRCADLIAAGLVSATADAAYLCGPLPMMDGIAAALEAAGMGKEAIRYEVFASNQPGRLPVPPASAAPVDRAPGTLHVTLDGARVEVPLLPGVPLLESALQGGIEAPWSCRAGVCSTCRCKVTKGTVEMAVNHALEDGEVARGFTLACQSFTSGSDIEIDFDH